MKNLNNMTKEQLLKEIDQLKDKVGELEKSELKSRIWLENSPVCTKIVDLDFNLQYMSSSGVRELKIDDITAFYGKPYPLHFYPDSFKIPMTKNLKRAKETGVTLTQEAPIVDVKGNTLWYHSTIIPVNNDKGQLDYIMVVSLETTARKLAEEALKEEKLSLLEAQKIALLGRWDLNLSNNHLQWSDGVFELFEIDPDKFEASYEAFLEAIHPDDREKVNMAYTESLKSKLPYEITHRLLMKDGRIKWVREKCRTEYDLQGNALRSIGIILDITEQKKSEQALQESSEKYFNLMNSLGTGVVLHAPDTSIILSNPKASEILGISPEQMQGKKAIDPRWKFIRNDSTDMPLEEYPVNKALRLMKSFSDYLIGIKRPDREYITWVDVNASLVFDENNNIKYVTISFNDTTERKKAEEELAKYRDNLETLVKERTNELEEKNQELDQALKVFVGREYKINELQEKIRLLEGS